MNESFLIFISILFMNLDRLLTREYHLLHRNLIDEKFLGTVEKGATLKKYLSVKYKYWNEGIKGKNTRIAILDSGIAGNYTKCHIKERINFSDEPEEDLNGHGTFICSLICDKDIGISPEAEIYIYKVFNQYRETKSEWLLKGLYKAIETKVNIINLSFGGINFDDQAIIQKLEEAASKGIIVITSAGNDGPSFGSINFPGNLPFVLTVGATGEDIFSILDVSSRGPAIYTKNALITKPNTWAPGENIIGYDLTGKLISKNGTSVSSALVTGYISLLISKFHNEKHFFNIGSLLLMLKDSNLNNPMINRGEIISGIFNLDGLIELTQYYLTNKGSLNMEILNNKIDFSLSSYSNYTINGESKIAQSVYIYSTMQPLYFSLIFINPENNRVNQINYNFHKENSQGINHLDSCVKLVPVYQNNKTDYFYFSNYVGVLQMKLYVDSDLKCRFIKEKVDWSIYFKESSNHLIGFKLIADIIPTPSKYSRILVHRYLNLYYPFDGLIPRDNLIENWYNFDWTYESTDTNYFGVYKHLKELDVHLEELNESLDCIDLSNYSVLMIVDNEKSLSDSEIERLRFEYEENHLSLFIITEWNEQNVKKRIKLENEGRVSVTMSTGGEISSLNKLLGTYGIEIGEDSISRDFKIGNQKLKIRSGSSIAKFPSKGFLFGNYLKNDFSLIDPLQKTKLYRAILGFLDQLEGKPNSGRVSIFTDTYCLDDYQLCQNAKEENCFWMIGSIIKFLIHGNFIHNELQLKTKIPLGLDFDDVPNRNQNYTHENSTLENYVTDSHITCSFKNYSSTLQSSNLVNFIKYSHKSTNVKTSTIPNMISKYLFESENLREDKLENKLIEIVEDILYALVPICSVILFVILMIQCKKIRVRRNRHLAFSRNLAQLKQTTSIRPMNLNDSTESSSIIINSLV